MKQYSLFLLVFFVCIQSSVAATIYARQDGDWDQTNRWSTAGVGGASCSCVPGIGDDVIIDGYEIDIDNNTGNVSANSVIIRSSTTDDNARLRIQDGQTLTVTNDVTIFGNRATRDQTFRLEDDGSTINIGGNLVIDHDLGDDMILDFEDNTTVNVTGNFSIDKDGGDDIDVMLNETNGTTAQMDVDGNVTITFDGTSDASIEFFLNGSSSLLNIDGHCSVTCSGGNDVSFFEFDINDGSMVIDSYLSLSRSTDFGALEIDMDGGAITVDSIFTSSSGTLGGAQAVRFILDGDARITVTNGVDINMSGGDDLLISVNDNNGTTAQYNVGGNLDINKTGGDDINILVDDDDSQLLVNGDMTIVSNGGEEVTIILDNDALFQVDGDFTLTHSSGQSGEIELSASPDNSEFTIGGNMNITYSGGSDLFTFDLNGGTVSVTGNVTMTNSGSGNDVHLNADGGQFNVTGNFNGILTGNDELLIDLDEDAQMNVTGNMELDISGGNDIELHLGQNSTNSTATLNVTGNLTLDHNGATGGDDIQFLINDDTEVSVGGVFTMDTDGSGSAGNFYCRIFDNGILDLAGNFVMTSVNSSYLEVTLNDDSRLEIGGNFVRAANPNNFGLLTCNDNSVVEYNGTSSQVFSEDDGAGTDGFTYQNVIINNSFGASPQITMEGLATVNGQITWTDGVVSSTSANILVLANGASSTTATDASHIDGPLRKIGNSAFTFPIGNNGVYRSLAMDAPSATTDAFDAQYFQTDPDASYSTSSLDAGLNNVSRVEYWTLDRTAGSSNVFVTLSWNSTSDVGNLSELRVSRWNGTQWDDHGNGATTGNTTDGTIRTLAAVSTFSPFTLASTTTNNPLPIELLSFTGIRENDRTKLRWTTITEINNDYFTVLKSADGINFEPISYVEGAGTYNGKLDYELIDFHPKEGTNYYRLCQTDWDGSQTFSDIISVEFQSTSELSVFPNPFNDQLMISNLPSEVHSIELYNIQGVRIWAGVAQSQLILPGDLTSGMYTICFKDSHGAIISSKRVVRSR